LGSLIADPVFEFNINNLTLTSCMRNYLTTGRIFYGLGIAGLGIQQFFYKDWRPVLMPDVWPACMHGAALAYLSGAVLLIAAILILLNKKTVPVSLVLGTIFLLLFLGFHAPYQLFVTQYSFHLGLWTNGLKELALSGGAFIIAGAYLRNQLTGANSFFISSNGLILIGRIFFSITMISFGIDHFLYTDFVTTLVPNWIPGHVFWMYCAGVLLIGSGVAFITGIALKLVAQLYAVMLFLWVLVLHIPRTVADFYGAKGNELTSVFEALAFCGIGLLIAYTADKRNSFPTA